MFKAMERELDMWNCLISIPVFGIRALTGSITLIENGQSDVIEVGLKGLLGNMIVFFSSDLFRPMKQATISLGDAVLILGGHSEGNRLSTIGRHEIFFDDECSKALKSAIKTTEPLIFS